MQPVINRIPGLEFIKKFAKGLSNMLVAKLKPRFNSGDQIIDLRLRRSLFDAQAVRVEALGRLLDDPKERTGMILGDMGTGKTAQGIATALRYFLSTKKLSIHVAVACPPTLVSTWREEIEATLPEGLYSFVDFLRHPEQVKPGINFMFMPYSQIRRHYHTQLAAVTTFRSDKTQARIQALALDPEERAKKALKAPELLSLETIARCPRCGGRFEKSRKKVKKYQDDEVKDLDEITWYTIEELQRKAQEDGRAIRCETPRFAKKLKVRLVDASLVSREYHDWRSTPPRQDKPRLCGEILLRPVRNKNLRNVSDAYLAKKKFKNRIDLVLADEIHALKNDGAQGKAGRWLMSAAKKALALTGTLTGGYARDLFYLLWTLSYRELSEDGYTYQMLARFCEQYGSKETKEVQAKGGKLIKRTSQMTGISAAIYERYLVQRTVFLSLEDLERDLCPFSEFRVSLSMTEEMQQAYNRVACEFRRCIGAARSAGFKLATQLVSKYLHATLSWPDRLCADKVNGKLVKYDANGDALPGEFTISINLNDLIVDKTPKDEWLINKILEEKRRGRKVLLYYTYSNERDCGARLKAVLEKAGIRVALLRSASVCADKRKEWIFDKAAHVDALLTHPDLVKEGMNLLQFPTIVWMQPDYNIYRLRQASKRSRRLNQTEPVEVYYLYYEDCTQEQAWALIASKLDSALLAEGNPADCALFEISYSPDSVFRGLINALIEGSDDALKLKSRVVSTVTEILSEESAAQQETLLPQSEVCEGLNAPTPSAPQGRVLVTKRITRGRKRITITREIDLAEVELGAQLALFQLSEKPSSAKQAIAI